MINNENKYMRVLSALGIIFIVSGHLGLSFFEINGLFPYYSFHVYIFLFVAGYFYSTDSSAHAGKYILKKAKNLLIPYFICNLIYGLINTYLNTRGFSFGGDISLYNLFVAPFFGGHQFMLNAPSWFLISLFILETLNVLLRCLLKNIRLDERSLELIFFIVTLVLGIIVIYLSIGGHIWGFRKDIARIIIMYPGFMFGRIYRTWIEPETSAKFKSNVSKILLSLGVMVAAVLIQLIIKCFAAGLAFSTVWVSGFASGPVVPYLTVITGIAFWLSVSKILVILLSYNEITSAILENIMILGRHTKSIMLHHIFVFFVINTILYGFNFKNGAFPLFDTTLYMSDVYYAYGSGNYTRFLWAYLLMGLLIPLLFAVGYGFIKTSIKNRVNKDEK